ncbi:FAD-dependent oxidoreductase [Candidatus Uhrbacteria bacterium]|jgi:NAD(P)H-nitrite reductase large subunit|nr:FAD-dependent oxidoreductase [Candidatus Uhrbacteria bacterium]
MAKQFVIIGGGIAGTTAADQIRKIDADASITIIDEEFHPLYSRILLVHYLEEKVPRERVFMKKLEWYTKNNIELMSGVIAKAIDTKNKFVTTSDDRELPYDELLITTGGELRMIEDDRRGIAYFRSMDDADYILKLVNELRAQPKKDWHGLIYGGGFIAIEFIKIFDHYNIPMTIMMRGDGFWSRVLSDHSKKVLADHAKAGGVTIINGVKEFDFIGEGDFEGVVVDGKEIKGQMLGVGIGMQSKAAFVREAGIEMDQGIVANSFLETSTDNVYTAGDIAQYEDVSAGRSMVAGNWMKAVMQGRVVAQTMTGTRTEFELVSSYSTHLMGKEIVFIGDTDRSAADKVVQHVAEAGDSVELFERDGRTVGALFIGSVKERQAITNAIKKSEIYAR